MRFSENWLRSFIDPPADRDELVRRLTMAGLEVEAVEGGLQVCEQYTVEVEGQAKPACVARAIMRLYF